MTVYGLSAEGFACSVVKQPGAKDKTISRLGLATEQPAGVWNSFAPCGTSSDIVTSAFSTPFPLGAPPPLPGRVADAVERTTRGSGPRLVQFLRGRLSLLDKFFPREGHAPSSFNADACRFVSAECGLCPEGLIESFAAGFPTVGDLDVPNLFPSVDLPSPQRVSV